MTHLRKTLFVRQNKIPEKASQRKLAGARGSSSRAPGSRETVPKRAGHRAHCAPPQRHTCHASRLLGSQSWCGGRGDEQPQISELLVLADFVCFTLSLCLPFFVAHRLCPPLAIQCRISHLPPTEPAPVPRPRPAPLARRRPALAMDRMLPAYLCAAVNDRS